MVWNGDLSKRIITAKMHVRASLSKKMKSGSFECLNDLTPRNLW